MEHLHQLFLLHEVEHRRKVDAFRQRVDRRRRAFARDLHQAELRVVGLLADELGIHGDVMPVFHLLAEGDQFGLGSEGSHGGYIVSDSPKCQHYCGPILSRRLKRALQPDPRQHPVPATHHPVCPAAGPAGTPAMERTAGAAETDSRHLAQLVQIADVAAFAPDDLVAVLCASSEIGLSSIAPPGRGDILIQNMSMARWMWLFLRRPAYRRAAAPVRAF